MLDRFCKEVRLKFNLDAVLSNRFNYKEGTFYYWQSEDYKNEIEHIYNSIDSDLKNELVEFIDIHLSIYDTEVRTAKQNLKRKNEHTDYAKDYIYSFVKLKYKFFKKWVKVKSFKAIKQEKNKAPSKEYKWHILIEPLVSGTISKIQKEASYELGKTELSKLIIQKLNLEIELKSIAPYIQYSFIENKEHPKNLFTQKKVKGIFEYCKTKDILIKDEVFLDKLKRYKLV